MAFEPPGGTPPPQPAWQPPPGPPFPASSYATGGYTYPSPSTSMPLKGLTTALTIMLVLSCVTALFAVFAFFHRASVVDDLSHVTFQEVKDADDLVGAAVGFFGLALLATGVVWIIWQFRYAKNAQTLRGAYGLTPGWAIGGWFVPIGNFVLPQLQLLQATKASDPDLPPGQPASAGRAPGTLIAWWVLIDVAWFLFSLGRGMRPGNGELDTFADLDRFVRADRISAISALLFIAAGIVSILLVRAVSERQARSLERNGPQPQPTAYPQYPQYPQTPGYGPPPAYAPPPAYPPPYQAPPPPAPPAPPAPPPPPPQQAWPPPPAPPPPQ